eukprot:s3822_g1.t1
MVCLVMVDSATGYMHAAPLRRKNQSSLMVRDLLGFASVVGHSELVFMCDNEPALVQPLRIRMTVNARLSVGLPTRKTTSAPYAHSNSLAERVVGRIRPLAGSLMPFLSNQVGVEFSTNSPWWSCAFRHAAFLINRYIATRGATPYELLYAKDYGGATCCFGELVLVYFAKVSGKGTANSKVETDGEQKELPPPTDDPTALVSAGMPADGMPLELWSDFPVDKHPPEPEELIDRIADSVELSRLCKMNVLVEGNSGNLGASDTLTTKFVYDWRLKDRQALDGSSRVGVLGEAQ